MTDFSNSTAVRELNPQSISCHGTMSQCLTCRERSNWGFLKEFYHRVDTANHYSQRLEVELNQCRIIAHTQAAALAECQSKLEDERLEHRGCKEALQFEKNRHDEADRCVECAYDVARQAGEITDSLRSENAKLKGNQLADDTVDSKPAPSTADLLFDLSIARKKADVFQGIANANDPAAFSEVQILKVMDENDDLQRRLHDAEYKTAQSEQTRDEIEAQLDSARAKIAYLQQTTETSSIGSGMNGEKRSGKRRMVKKE
ncbi:MAG: hypothetical protein M1840_006344 [Geoglossum simile]|nr:MAG: hypothetical protein M1840_006344 [Geoglossum simile]